MHRRKVLYNFFLLVLATTSSLAAVPGGPADLLWLRDGIPLYEKQGDVLPPLFTTALAACQHYGRPNDTVAIIEYDAPYGYRPKESYRELGFVGCYSGTAVRKVYVCPLTPFNGFNPSFSEPIAGQPNMFAKVTCPGGVQPPEEPLQLVVTSATDMLPTSAGATSTIPLTAKVTSASTPQQGVALSFSVDVIANSGGHEHHNAARPKGTFNAVQGTTDTKGEVKVTFTAPEVAGIHTIKVTCATCSNSPITKEIQVKVPNLVEMLPDTARPATYTLVGANGNHKSNHWFSSASVVTLGKVADAMFKTGWGVVGVNDGSLTWGGLFDIKGGWTPSHHEHRVGTEVDLSVTNPRQITDEQKKKAYAELCKKNNAAFSIQTLWHQDDGYPEHFHMYLDGSGLTDQAGGGPCCARYKTTRPKVDKKGKPVLDKHGKPVLETVALCEETTPR